MTRQSQHHNLSYLKSHSPCACGHGLSRDSFNSSRYRRCCQWKVCSFFLTLIYIIIKRSVYSPQVCRSFVYFLYLYYHEIQPAMRSLRKRHSWPPLRKPRAFYIKEKIDDDPFCYFISPVEDRTIFTESYLTAGIASRQRPRSLSPVPARRISQTKFSATKSPTLRLKKWIERMEKYYFNRSSPSLQPQAPIIEVREPKQADTGSPTVRGRPDVRSSSHSRISQTLGTPPRKPRVWRKPSEDIWTVVEEGEEVGLGISA